jgi:nitrous oxidase accessory protein NosD
MTHAQFSLAVALLAVVGLNVAPAQAQPTRVFVAAQGNDANPCTFPQPCRRFQQAHDTVAAGGEIDVLDPAGYGSLIISKSIKIQGHGFSGMSVTGNTNGISIAAGATDVVVLQGLVIEGGGASAGGGGIYSTIVGSLAVEDCEFRDFTTGIFVTGSRLEPGLGRERMYDRRQLVQPSRNWLPTSLLLSLTWTSARNRFCVAGTITDGAPTSTSR